MSVLGTKHLQPHFFIIGERKCGTSSLYRYLLQHPQVLPAQKKELQFFTKSQHYIKKHFRQYLEQFPLIESTQPIQFQWPELDSHGILYEETLQFQRKPGQTYYSGEASADTFAEVAPEILYSYLPHLRLILLLRDPVERAYSHYRMLLRFQEEGRELSRPIYTFEEDLAWEIEHLKQEKPTLWLGPGLYIEPLKKWLQVWPTSSFLILFSEDLEPSKGNLDAIDRVSAHLGLSPIDKSQTDLTSRHNQAPITKIPKKAEKILRDFYRPSVSALENFLQIQSPWDMST